MEMHVGRFTMKSTANGNSSKAIAIPVSMVEKMIGTLDKSEYQLLLYTITQAQCGKDPIITLPGITKLSPKVLLSRPGVMKALRGLVRKGYLIPVDHESYRICMPEDEFPDDDMVLEV